MGLQYPPDNSEKEASIPLFHEAYVKAVAHNEGFYAVDAAHMLGIVSKDQLHWNLTALRLAENMADTGAKEWLPSLYNNIGRTYHELKDYAGALTFFEKLLALRLDQRDERGTFIAKWTIGRTHRSLGRIDEALTLQGELSDEIQRKGLHRWTSLYSYALC